MVVFLSLLIFGNMISVNCLINLLFEVGVEVIYGKINNIYIFGYGG